MLIQHLAYADAAVARGYKVYELSRDVEVAWRCARRHSLCTTEVSWPPPWYFNPDEPTVVCEKRGSGVVDPEKKRRTEEPRPGKLLEHPSPSSLAVAVARGAAIAARTSSSTPTVAGREALSFADVLFAAPPLPPVRRVSKKERKSVASVTDVLLAVGVAEAQGAAHTEPPPMMTVAVADSVSAASTNEAVPAADGIAVATAAEELNGVSDVVAPRSATPDVLVESVIETVPVDAAVSGQPYITPDRGQTTPADSSIVSAATTAPSGMSPILIPDRRGLIDCAWMAACVRHHATGRQTDADIDDEGGRVLAKWMRSLPEPPCAKCPLSTRPCTVCLKHALEGISAAPRSRVEPGRQPLNVGLGQ